MGLSPPQSKIFSSAPIKAEASQDTPKTLPMKAKTRQDTPKTLQDMVQTVKKLATTIVSSFIPVPLLPEFVEVVITVLEACEDVITIEDSAKNLQKRIFSLSVILIDELRGKDSEEFEGRIRMLESTLNMILEDLEKIKGQENTLLIFRDLNKKTVDECLDRVDEALEQFHLSQGIEIELLVKDILSKYFDVNNHLSHQLEEIEQAVQNANRPHHAPTILPRQDVPPKGRIFYGRESFVDVIASLIAHEDTSRVCITGAHGMGKTSVALAVMDSPIVHEIFSKEYQFWVPCVEAGSANILLRILYTQLRVTAESYDSVDTLINELNASKQRRVLVLDNFETPCFSGSDANREQVRGIISRLASLSHVALLVTMTSSFPPSDDIIWQNQILPPLDPVAAREAFKGVYPDTVDEKLDELLDAIGRVPLAITLMAANAKHLQSSPQDLLGEWESAGTDMISSMDRTISLSVNHEVVKSNSAALMLLATLSLLPAGTTGDHLRWWAPGVTSESYTDAIGMLRMAALVEQEEGEYMTVHIFVRPTVQAYMAQHHRIPDEVRQQVHDACYQYVLAHKSIPDDVNFKDDLSALANEEKNIQVLLMQIKVATLRPHALDALIAFSMYQYWTKPSTVVALHALEVARTVQNDLHVADAHVAARHVSQAHQCLGKIFLILARYDTASQHFEDARRGFKSFGGLDHIHVGECSMELANTWMHMGKHSQGIELLVSDAQADLSHDESNKYHVARGLLGLGDFLLYTTQYGKALETLSSASAIFEELNCPASTSRCLYLISQSYAQQSKHAEALGIAKQALQKAEQAGDSRHIGDILNVMARNLIGLSLHDDAVVIIERALRTYQALGSPVGIAQMLELLGYTCAIRLDFAGARVAYEGARVQFGNVRSLSAELNGARCTRNLDRMQTLEPTGLSMLEKPFLY